MTPCTVNEIAVIVMHGQIAKNSDVAVVMTFTFLPTPYVKKYLLHTYMHDGIVETCLV